MSKSKGKTVTKGKKMESANLGAVKKLTLRDVIIEAIHAQTEIDSANEVVNLASSSVSDHLLTAAKHFHDAEKFVLACKVDEDFIKSDEAGVNKADKMPRCWTNAKSNIKRALELGFNLNDYETESSLRKAVGEKRAESEGDDTPDVIDSKLLDSNDEGNDPRLIQRVNALMKRLASVTNEGVEAAIEAIDKTIEEIDSIILTLVPEEPVKVDEVEQNETAVA